MKQRVTRLVKNVDVVVNNAETFYDTCVKHLEKPMDTSDRCQPYMLTFELQRKICKRPSTEKWPGIPDTRKLHQIGNTGGGGESFVLLKFLMLLLWMPTWNSSLPK